MSGKESPNDSNSPFKEKEKEGGERKSQLDPIWESRDKKPFGCHCCGVVQNILYGGKVVASPKSGPW
jgi:hypothetical protein